MNGEEEDKDEDKGEEEEKQEEELEEELRLMNPFTSIISFFVFHERILIKPTLEPDDSHTKV